VLRLRLRLRLRMLSFLLLPFLLLAVISSEAVVDCIGGATAGDLPWSGERLLLALLLLVGLVVGEPPAQRRSDVRRAGG
jgi:hypothetical protein